MIQDDIISLDANYYYLSIVNASKQVMYSYHIYNGPSLMKEIYVYDPYSYDISGHIQAQWVKKQSIKITPKYVHAKQMYKYIKNQAKRGIHI